MHLCNVWKLLKLMSTAGLHECQTDFGNEMFKASGLSNHFVYSHAMYQVRPSAYFCHCLKENLVWTYYALEANCVGILF